MSATEFFTTAIGLIFEERRRQITEEGYTPLMDDKNGKDYYEDLICAAGTYEMDPMDRGRLETWPWDTSSFKPTYQDGYRGRIRELEKSGALYMAAKAFMERNDIEGPVREKLPYRILRVAETISELMVTIKEKETA